MPKDSVSGEMQTIAPGMRFYNGRMEQDPVTTTIVPTRRDEIVFNIENRLGKDLAAIYHDAIRSAVDIGQFDREWMGSPPYTAIEKYVGVLYQDWYGKQGNIMPIVVRVHHLMTFGSDEEKAALKKLLDL